MIRPLLCALLLLWAVPLSAQTVFGPEVDALAEPALCRTSVAGARKTVLYDRGDRALKDRFTLVDAIPGMSDRLDCPPLVTLRILTPALSDAERQPFCLLYDRRAETFTGFAEGARGAGLTCSAPTGAVCRRVEASKDAALGIARLGADTAARIGEMSVTQSAGAVILSGSSSAISGALGSLGAGVAAALSAPATLAAAAVTVVAVGGAVYVCAQG